MSTLCRPINTYVRIHPNQSVDDIKRDFDFSLIDWQASFRFQYFRWTKCTKDQKRYRRRQRYQAWRRLNRSIARYGRACVHVGQATMVANHATEQMRTSLDKLKGFTQ